MVRFAGWFGYEQGYKEAAQIRDRIRKEAYEAGRRDLSRELEWPHAESVQKAYEEGQNAVRREVEQQQAQQLKIWREAYEARLDDMKRELVQQRKAFEREKALNEALTEELKSTSRG